MWELVDGRSVFSHGPVHLGSGHFESSHLSMLDEHAQVTLTLTLTWDHYGNMGLLACCLSSGYALCTQLCLQ